MYDVGQGNNIKDGKGKVFEIELKDTVSDKIYPCSYIPFDSHTAPLQIPLGSYDKRHWTDYDAYDANDAKQTQTKEPYTDDNQHTRAGEMSDMMLFSVPCVLILMLFIYIAFFKKYLKT